MKRENTIDHITALIFNISDLIRQQLRHQKNYSDVISLLRLKVLHYVAEKVNPLMKEVADNFYISPPSATILVNHLVETKMLKRITDKKDRRVVRLSLTPKGKKVLEKEFNKINSRLRKILIKFNKKEQEELIKILEKISNIYLN
jgi:DNA-binding MarR family transcriptional regulator